MSYHFRPTLHNVPFWISVPFVVLILLFVFEGPEWSHAFVASSYAIIAIFFLILRFTRYFIHGNKFTIQVFYLFNSTYDLNTLISIRYRENSRFKQFMGLPPKTIVLYFERIGHVELWNSDSELFELCEEQFTEKEQLTTA